eukprot:scaffold50670_cov50-Prasinocladus_malaysianus.AAC.1
MSLTETTARLVSMPLQSDNNPISMSRLPVSPSRIDMPFARDFLVVCHGSKAVYLHSSFARLQMAKTKRAMQGG